MARVALLVHSGRPDAIALAGETAAWLRSEGHEVLLPESPQLADVGDLDLVIGLGGDGTILRAVDLALPGGVPVLGVNLGRLGYLTEVEPGLLRQALEDFLKGEHAVEERMTLDVHVERLGREEMTEAVTTALNEAVLERSEPGHTIRVAVSLSDRAFVRFLADGLIVATPTGSTAYSFSARGPILDPLLEAIVVTPVSPHMLFDRSLVLEPSAEVRLEFVEGTSAELVVDGQRVTTLLQGDSLVCRRGRRSARFVRFGARDFHAIVRAKFGLADR